MLSKILQVYSILNYDEDNRLVPHQTKVLLYYLKNGLSEETLQAICEDIGYEKNYLHGVNKKLRDRGYLIKDKNNQHKFFLNEDLENIRKSFLHDKSKGYIINFQK